MANWRVVRVIYFTCVCTEVIKRNYSNQQSYVFANTVTLVLTEHKGVRTFLGCSRLILIRVEAPVLRKLRK